MLPCCVLHNYGRKKNSDSESDEGEKGKSSDSESDEDGEVACAEQDAEDDARAEAVNKANGY